MTINIAFSLDRGYFFGLLAAVNSVIQNTTQAPRLVFHVVTPPGDAPFFQTELPRYFPDQVFRVAEYHPNARIQAYVQRKNQPKTQKAFNAIYSLYSRLFLPELFPGLGKVIFLDTDLVVIQDIAEVFDQVTFTPETYFAAAPHFFPAIFHFSRPWLALRELRQFEQTFNAGVFMTDLSLWSQTDYDRLNHYLAWDEHYNCQLFTLNDETILNLMFKKYLRLHPKWNRCGYGNLRLVSWLMCKPRSQMAVIHWSGGHHKPWSSKNIPYADIWQQYALLQPNG